MPLIKPKENPFAELVNENRMKRNRYSSHRYRRTTDLVQRGSEIESKFRLGSGCLNISGAFGSRKAAVTNRREVARDSPRKRRSLFARSVVLLSATTLSLPPDGNMPSS